MNDKELIRLLTLIEEGFRDEISEGISPIDRIPQLTRFVREVEALRNEAFMKLKSPLDPGLFRDMGGMKADEHDKAYKSLVSGSNEVALVYSFIKSYVLLRSCGVDILGVARTMLHQKDISIGDEKE